MSRTTSSRWGACVQGVRLSRVGAAVLALCLMVTVATASPGVAASAGGSFKWSSPERIDEATEYVKPARLGGISCPSGTRCVGVGSYGSVEISPDVTSPGSWHGFSLSRGIYLEGVSCPSASLCVAVSDFGDIYSSANPAGGPGAWHKHSKVLDNPGTDLGAVACPTTSLCVAVNGTGEIATSVNPGSANPTWSVVNLGSDHQLGSVSCPSSTRCLVLDFNGAVFASTNPTGAVSAWAGTSAPFDNDGPLNAIACVSTTSCVVADEIGQVVTSADPFAATPVWKTVHVDGLDSLNAISCASSGVCVAADGNGNLLTSTDPAGGKPAWVRTRGVDPSGFLSVTCQSASLCLAGGYSASVATSVAPGASNPAWRLTPQLGSGAVRFAELTGLSCASSHMCVMVDDAGNALSTARPAGPGAGWRLTSINPGLTVNDVSCVTGLCLAVGPNGGYVAASTTPLSAAPAWNLTDLDLHSFDNNGSPQLDSLTSSSCASRTFCVATRGSFSTDNFEVSLDPAAASPTWDPRAVGQFDLDFFRSVSCPSRSLCVAADGQLGKVGVSTDAGKHWKLTYVEAPGEMNGSLTPSVNDVSCPTTSLCVAVDDHRQVITTHNAAGGHKAWHVVRLGPGHTMTAVTCASPALCVGLGQHGRVQVSTRPAGPTSAWRYAPINAHVVDASCPSTRLCLLITSNGELIIGQRR
jgi:hypothetical protein